MNKNLQIDNPSHFNIRREQEKAHKALVLAKQIKKKPIFISQGVTGEMLYGTKTMTYLNSNEV